MLIKKVYTVYKLLQEKMSLIFSWLLLFSLHIVHKIYPYTSEQGTLAQPIHIIIICSYLVLLV